MRTIRFRVQGGDARSDWFSDDLAIAIRNDLTAKGWSVISPVSIYRPNGWTGLTRFIFDFTVSVYDFYPNDYITNETIKEQLRSDLEPILDIDWITMLSTTDRVAADTGGFMFDSTNRNALKEIVPGISSLGLGFVAIIAAVLLLNRR